MGRAFGELDAAFYDAGRVMSIRTCVAAPLPRARLARPPLVGVAKHVEAVSLGVPECVELGGYYACALDSTDDHADYASYELAAD